MVDHVGKRPRPTGLLGHPGHEEPERLHDTRRQGVARRVPLPPTRFDREALLAEQRATLDRILAEVDADHEEPRRSPWRRRRSTIAGCVASRLWDGARAALCLAATHFGRCSRRNVGGSEFPQVALEPPAQDRPLTPDAARGSHPSG